MKGKKAFVFLIAALFLISFTSVALAQGGGKVNINTASAEELTTLKRVGPSYAKRIIDYREQNGPFEKPQDIMKVPGIGEKTWEANSDLITVN